MVACGRSNDGHFPGSVYFRPDSGHSRAMTSPQRLPTSLTPLDAALDALLERGGTGRAGGINAQGSAALHRRRDAAAPAYPPRDIAAADGYAFCARDLVGASSYSPLLLSAPPVWVEAGEAIPEACDCVLDSEFRRSVRPDAAGAGGGDSGAGRAPGRRRYCRRQSRRGGRAARAAARSPDRARRWNGTVERPPSAAAHRQCSRWQRDGRTDRGERACHRR